MKKAIELTPRNAWAYSRRASVYLRVHDTQQASADFLRSCELEARNMNETWMAQWCGICLERDDLRTVESLEKIAAIDPQNYIAYMCRGVAWYLQKSFEQSLIELEQATLLEPEEWDAYFWKGMVCAALKCDKDAKSAVEKSLEVDLPPVLLAPLRWFEQDRPDFYEQYVVPLLARYV